MKTYRIEVQRFKAASFSHGLINVRLDAVVQAQTPRQDDDAPETVPTSSFCLTEADARVLMSLLKTQIAELDKRKARSRF